VSELGSVGMLRLTDKNVCPIFYLLTELISTLIDL